ncbi:MAG: 3-deoxy-7-phosphoheptulonate synthase [Alphaproteobacteria bacterium]|nr:3-deoxy-7-phosphoheptulonate synthase [Alphaproteobacteria bacterium]
MTIENAAPGKDITAEDMRSKFPLAAAKHPGHRSIVEVGGVAFGAETLPVMAGPNTVESRALILDIARTAKAHGASLLRGGAFKPLTFPYRSASYFEPGAEALGWLAEARAETGLLVVTEVMSEAQLPGVCAVADMVQIGARNMQNYPLLTAAARTGKPILLKRHFGASLRDWLGAAEYIMVEGNHNVVLCERGISAPHTHRATSRFLLDLQVVPAAREVTHLPVITDPSHATFWREWVAPLALASVAAGADGVMLEVHPEPARAAVDPLQAIDYAAFSRLMRDLDRIAHALGRQVRPDLREAA